MREFELTFNYRQLELIVELLDERLVEAQARPQEHEYEPDFVEDILRSIAGQTSEYRPQSANERATVKKLSRV